VTGGCRRARSLTKTGPQLGAQRFPPHKSPLGSGFLSPPQLSAGRARGSRLFDPPFGFFSPARAIGQDCQSCGKNVAGYPPGEIR
jgi:hypothetical protein